MANDSSSIPAPVRAVAEQLHQALIARFPVPVEGPLGDVPVEHRSRHRFHFFTVTVVPLPASDTISNSSMSRLTPGRPTPRRPDVE